MEGRPAAEPPLSGLRVLVPRPAHQAEALAAPLRALGADPLCLPVLRVLPPTDPEPLRRAAAAVRAGRGPTWLAFTSRNGVDAFFAALGRAGGDARDLHGVRLAAIGPATAAALRERELRADLVPEEYRGEAVAEALLAAMGDPSGVSVLIPRAEVAREALPEALRAAGCRVEVVAAYRTAGPDEPTAEALRRLYAETPPEASCFTSPSSVRFLLEALGEAGQAGLRRSLRVAIGPITEAALRRAGLPADVVARDYTAEGLVRALAEHVRGEAGPAPASRRSP